MDRKTIERLFYFEGSLDKANNLREVLSNIPDNCFEFNESSKNRAYNRVNPYENGTVDINLCGSFIIPDEAKEAIALATQNVGSTCQFSYKGTEYTVSTVE